MTSLVSRSILTGPDSVSCLSISTKLVASGFENGSVCLWSPTECDSPIFLLPSSSACTALKFGSDKNAYTLYSAHYGDIISWDLRKVTDPMETWQISKEEINSIDLLKTSNYLAAADDDGAVHLISTKHGTSFNILKNHENICTNVKFRPNYTNQILSAGLDCRLIISDWKNSHSKVCVFKMQELVGPTAYADLLEEDELLELSVHDEDEKREENDSEEEDDEGESSEEEDDDDSLSYSPNNHLASKHDSDSNEETDNNNAKSSLRVASSYTRAEVKELAKTRIMGHGIGLNPPMVHCMVCTQSGDYIAVGLENSTIEIFRGHQTHLRHSESLFGHRRGVATLLAIGESHLVSGGNDCGLFVWELTPGGAGHEFSHSKKISALAGHDMSTVYMADLSPVIQVLDLSLL